MPGKTKAEKFLLLSNKDISEIVDELFLIERLSDLKITIVCLGKALAEDQDRDQVPYNPSRFTTNKLHWIRVLFLRHDGASSGYGVTRNQESKLF